MKNYYSVLGVTQGADYESIKAAYRKLAKENHPDLHPGDAAKEEIFKTVNEAWQTLSDDKKRREYDLTLSGAGRKPAAAQKNRTAPVGKVDIEEMMKNFGGIFSEEALQNEAEKKAAGKAPFASDEMFRKFMGFK